MSDVLPSQARVNLDDAFASLELLKRNSHLYIHINAQKTQFEVLYNNNSLIRYFRKNVSSNI